MQRLPERCGTVAQAARSAWALPAMQFWARKVVGERQEHPFSARAAPLKAGSSLMTLGGFLAKTPIRLLSQCWTTERGIGLLFTFKKEKDNFLNEGKRKPAGAEGSNSLQLFMRRVGCRNVKPFPTGTYSLCLNEGDRGAKVFQGKVFCRHTGNYIIFVDLDKLEIKSESFTWFGFFMEEHTSIHTGTLWCLLKLFEAYVVF